MTIQSYVPTIWAADLLENLNDAHVYANPMVVNRDYEGDIKGQGSSVKINSIGRITVSNYTRNTAISAPEVLDTADQVLNITEAKYFNFAIDSVDKVQARGALRAAAMKEAAWSIAEEIDAFIAALQSAAIDGTTNDLTNGSPITVGTGAGQDDIYGILVELGVLLDNNNTPQAGRFAVFPPFAEGMMRLDERFVSFGTAGNKETLRGAPISTAAGFTIFKSNNTPSGASSSKEIIVGYKGATTFAEQINEMKAYEPDLYFNDAIKELHVYGGKVTRPANLAKAEVLAGSYRG